MRPLIAVTTTIYDSELYRTPQVMLGTYYLAAVEAMGGVPVLLTPAHTEASRERILELAHGLLLTGGEDIDPACYGQAPHPKLQAVVPERDEMELAALDGALERDLPVLAICRGCQLLNVGFGGTLYQDIPSQLGGDLTHSQTAPLLDRWHDARVRPGSRLADIFGATELYINSFHHQAVDRVGQGLEPVAWAEDGLVEALEGTDHSWVFGVQWHPERGEAHIYQDRREPDARLFWEFVHAASCYAEHGTPTPREPADRTAA